ncbi:Sphingosine N-acyltransferase lag1 [Hypoxylon texense]
MEPRTEKVRTPRGRPSLQSRKSSMNGPLYMQTSNNKVLIRRVKRKGDGPMRNLARWFLDNQTGLSFNLIALIFLAHMFIPKARPHTSKFFTLSYYDPATEKYAIGPNDYHFIAFCYLYVNSSYYLNLRELWTNWPIRELGGVMKAYLLAQWAFWVQQVLVIHIEERRKDHYQMLTHHFITITLITASYFYHQDRVGNLILVLMDVVDLFLPLAKCLKYLGYSRLCDAMFVVFMVSWFIARHVFYLMTCYSIYTDLLIEIPDSCYRGPSSNLTGPFPVPDGWGHWLEPFTDSEGTVCWTSNVRLCFLYCLLGLQVITIFWFCMIIKVAARVIRGDGADDTRSDDEGMEEEEEEEEFEYEEAQPLEEEVGVEAIDLKGWERRTGVKRGASSSGVSLPGHSDRKELLGRIGCEKQVD